MSSLQPHYYIFGEELALTELSKSPVRVYYIENRKCCSYPENVPQVVGEWSSKGKSLKVALLVEHSGVPIAVSWGHLIQIRLIFIYILTNNWKQMRLTQGQIVWAMHPQHYIKWPAKVTKALPNKSVKVAFFHFKSYEESIVIHQSQCRDFSQYEINQKDSPILLYQAYKLAKAEYAKSKQGGNKKARSDWSIDELRKQVDKLLMQPPQEEDIERLRIGFFNFKLIPNETRIYFKERFCQKLAYLGREESTLNNELVYAINYLRQSMKTMLLDAFSEGQI